MNFLTNLQYQEIATEKSSAKFYGIIVYKKNQQGAKSVETLLYDIENDAIDFNELLGSFRIIIKHAEDGIIFFGDNSNNCCFYYSIKEPDISDTFLAACEKTPNKTIDYDSVAQFLQFGCIYGNDTMFREIKRTDSDCYYTVSEGIIYPHSKKLKSFGEITEYHTLNEFFNTTLDSLSGLKIADVVTGGVDSRMVLIHLLRNGISPELFIAEEPDHIDVRIAAKISKIINSPFNVISKDYASEDFLEDAFVASDGVFAPCSRYTLVLMRREIKRKGFNVVFGGVCGELYKNSFINQDFPFYSGDKANIDKFYRIKIAPTVFPDFLCGKAMANSFAETPSKIKSHLKTNLHDRKRSSYFNMGYWLMKQRIISISNNACNTVPFMSPLLERNALSIAFKINPYLLEMQSFARKEISAYSRALASIETDRGLTCRTGITPLISECIANYIFMGRIMLNRCLRHNNTSNESNNSIYFVNKLRRSTLINQCLDTCIKHDIVPNNVDIATIPPQYLDRIFVVGMLLNYNVKCSQL